MSTTSTIPSQKARCSKKHFAPLFLSMLALGCLSTCRLAYSAPNQTPPQAYQNWVNNLGSIQLGVGTSLAQQVSIAAASNVTFSWQTNVANATGGKWSVTNSPSGPSLATGFVTCPGLGQLSQFTVPFGNIAPAKAPPSATPLVYFVTIAPVGANQKGLGLPSNTVRVIYAKP